MLLLVSTSDKVQLVTDSTATVDVHASYVDFPAPPTPGRKNTAISSATTTDIVAAPGGSVQRNVKTLVIRNKHASTTVTVTVQHTDGTTTAQLHQEVLAPGEALLFVDGVGFESVGPSYSRDAIRYVTSDSTHATAATFADVTGLTFAVLSGKKYAIDAHLIHQTNATTTGAQFGIGGVAMTEMMLSGIAMITASVTAAAYASSAAVTAVDTAFVVETTGPGAVNMIALMRGYFIPSASGTLAVRATSEVTVAGGLVVKKGSWARVTEFDN